MGIRNLVEMHLHPRDLLRNMAMFEVARSFLMIVLRQLWPGYTLIVLLGWDLLVALVAGAFDHPETRSWPRMMLAGLLVEAMRYGYTHAPHVKVG